MSEPPRARSRAQLPLPARLNPRGRSRHRPDAPATPGRSGLLRYARALSWVAVTCAAFVLIGSGGLWAYVGYLNGRIHRIGVFCLHSCGYARPLEAGSTENFLLVGSDTRSGSNSTGSLSGLAEGQAGQGGTFGLSDTTMLVHLSADRSKVIVLSFPRDMLVSLPSHKDAAGNAVPAQAAKFNAAYSVGGPALLVQQVEQLSGLRVDHFVAIDFAGFVNIVNALGGINVCIAAVPGITTNLRDPGAPSEGTLGSGFVGHVGVNHLGGLMALAYVRQRHGLPNGDLDRIHRQQRFLSAVFRKTQSAGTLLNPLKLNHVASSAAADITTDKGTSLNDLITLLNKLRGLDSGNIEFFTVPTTGGPEQYVPFYGAPQSVLNIVPGAAHTLFQQIHDDQDPAHPPVPAASATSARHPSRAPTSASPAPPVTIPPNQVRLAVENGTTTTGKGARAADALRQLGFAISSVTTASSSGEPTTIRYGSNRADSAATVAAAVPGAQLIADPTLDRDTLILTVGTNYQGTRAVTVTAGGSTSPTRSAVSPASTTASPTASASPPVTTADTTASAAGSCGP